MHYLQGKPMETPQNYHTCALFDPSKMGPI